MDYKFTFEDGSRVLAHYGVKGMKWGVWNDETRARYEGIKITGGGGAVDDEDDEDKKDGENSEIDDAMLNITNLANGNLMFTRALNNAVVSEYPDVFKKKETPGTADDDMKAVNPYYTAGYLEYKLKYELQGKTDTENWKMFGAVTNCADCSVIYDLRRRGYDVDANMTQNLAGKMNGGLDDYYIGAKSEHKSSKDDLEKDLNSMPDGARGTMCGITVNGGGHAIAWEKENGQLVYRDCQSNQKYDSDTIAELFAFQTSVENSALYYSRLDDKEPNLAMLYMDGLVSKGGTSGREDRIEDLIKSAEGSARMELRAIKKYFPEQYNEYAKYYKEALSDYKKLLEKEAI